MGAKNGVAVQDRLPVVWVGGREGSGGHGQGTAGALADALVLDRTFCCDLSLAYASSTFDYDLHRHRLRPFCEHIFPRRKNIPGGSV